MNILITGGSGLIGSVWIPMLLRANHQVFLLSRSRRTSGANTNLIPLVWDGKKIPLEEPVDAVVNLAGAPLADHRWTASYKEEIIQSRIYATKACVEFLSKTGNPQTVFVSASAVGYYGTHQEGILTEESPSGNDFLANTAVLWEKEALQASVRTVLLRLGVVLSKDGGAFPKILTPFKLYAGGQVGNGKQGFPWIHILDVLSALEFCIQNQAISGPVNAVAPESTSNKQFSEQLAAALNRPTFITIPEFMVELALGEASMLVTQGQLVTPAVLLKNNFIFHYSTLKSALNELLA